MKSEASFYSGSELLERCESDSAAKSNVCVGYLAGIDDITGTYDGWGDMDKEFCIPNSVDTSQLKKVFIKGANEIPEQLHLSASSIVWNIFAEAFPCD
tara:strand:- start:407 stop:700 length:294 start_codon:yes stop_codon:yes gene_type:complete